MARGDDAGPVFSGIAMGRSGSGAVHRLLFRAWPLARVQESMDARSPSSLTERVVSMKGTQLGGTECGNNWIGHVIACAPELLISTQN